MKKLIIILAFVIFTTILAYSQPTVVVSEYINASSPNTESTELLITADNVSLVGYTLRDNSQDTESWRPGIKFKDIPLWKNLRRGTIIIVLHRDIDTYGTDDDKSDGFISVAALNQLYFDHLELNLETSMNLNVTRDMIQIRDENDNNVHCLGHMGSPSADFTAITGYKLAYKSTLSQSASVQVCPGTNISDYDGGWDATSAKVSGDVLPATKGYPNKATGKPDVNHLFWRQLRQPDANPITAFNNGIAEKDSITLSWSVSSADDDTVQGFFIVRYEGVPDNSLPADSKIYNVGDAMGNGIVVGIVKKLTSTRFTDKYQGISCGKTFIYRIFVYRYDKDNSKYPEASTTVAENARGRAFHDDLAQMKEYSIKVEDVPTFTIVSENGSNKFCENDVVKLSTNPSNWNTNDYLIEWKNGANVIGTQSTLTITPVKGKYNYTLFITNKKSKCVQSVSFDFEILEKPSAFIKIENKSLQKDTTIYICNGESFDAEGYYLAQSNPSIKWIKDNVDFTTSTKVTINTAGIYKFITSLGTGLCPDTSFSITVIDKNIDFTLDKTVLNMTYPTNSTATFTIFNPNDDDICINESEIIIDNPLFTITNPVINAQNPCYKVPAKGSLIFTITYQPTKIGTDVGTLNIKAKCANEKTITLNGVFQDDGRTFVQFSPLIADYKSVIIDCKPVFLKVINLKKIGNDKIVMSAPTFTNNYFEIVDLPTTPFELKNELLITLNLLNTYQGTDGIYVDTLIIPHKISNIDTTLRIPIILDLFKVKYEFNTKLIDFSSSPKCQSVLDTIVKVKNIGRVEFTILQKSLNQKTEIINDVTIAPNEEKDVKLRFNFTDVNMIDIFINIDLPCELQVEAIRVNPPSEDLSITLIDETIDFGSINVCKQPFPYAGKIKVNGSGITIGKVINAGKEFKCETIKEGNPLTLSTGSLIFEALSGPNGKFSDSLQFYIEPCHELITIYVIGERYGPSSPTTELTANTFDFGMNSVGINQTETIIIKNPNKSDKIIIKSASTISPFFIINPNSFPIEIPADGQLTFEVEYRRNTEGAFLEEISFVIEEPCDFSNFKIVLKGSAEDNSLYELAVSIPKDLKPVIGEVFKIPVQFNMKNNATFKQLGIKSCDLYFSFNPNVIEVRKAYKGYDNLNDINISFPLYSEPEIGKFKVSFDVTNSDKLRKGEVIYLLGKALLGNNLTTEVVIDSAVITATNAFQVETEDGLVEVTGVCELGNRLLEVGNNANITIIGSNPSNESTKIGFSVITDDITTITIYNSLGEEVTQLVNSSIKPGVYEKVINTAALSEGVYFITMKSGINQKTIKFAVSK